MCYCRYALLYPDKLQDILEMCKYINEDPAPYDSGEKATLNRKLRKKIWLMENKDGYNPLQLAAKFGQHDIFTFIMNLEVRSFLFHAILFKLILNELFRICS